MNTIQGSTAFFELDGTVAQLGLSVRAKSAVEVAPFADVVALLRALRERGVRLGLILGEHEVAAGLLETAGLTDCFDPALVVPGGGHSQRTFARAAAQARHAAGDGTAAPPLYVGTSAEARVLARLAGLRTAPHPLLALDVLGGESLWYLRIRVPPSATGEDWRAPLREGSLVPLHLDDEPLDGGAAPVLYAVSTATRAAWLDGLGFWVDRLGSADLPQTTDLHLLRDDRQARTGFLRAQGNGVKPYRPAPGEHVLCSTHQGLIVALRGAFAADGLHVPEAGHGHTQWLGPSGDLLQQGAAEPEAFGPSTTTAIAACELTQTEIGFLSAIVEETSLRTDAERYAGIQPLNADLRVLSRHANHAHNLPVVLALEAQLTALSAELAVTLQQVRHRVFNVEARLGARAGQPLLPGIVVIGAHLDSTGKEDSTYVSFTGKAPGADDNASGMAGLLAALRALLQLRALDPARPQREIRVVFFNEEEEGQGGSQVYARALRKSKTTVHAMFQMDMIGYDGGSPRTFELHAGYPVKPAVQAASVLLAQLVADMAGQVSRTLVPQLYPAPGKPDPARGRSDHTSFHKNGFPACLVTEDFYDGPLDTDPPRQRNLKYHTPEDLAVDAAYAADIARAVAAAAWCAAVTP